MKVNLGSPQPLWGDTIIIKGVILVVWGNMIGAT